MNEEYTKGVKILLGDPKKAILKLSGPMVIAMLTQSLYNLADAIWVSGIGTDALAAIGLFFPINMIIISLASGLSVGGSSAISRKIGERNKNLASIAAMNSLFIGFILGILITLLLFPVIRFILIIVGASGNVLNLTLEYSRIIISFSIPIVFSNIAGGILRGEGDTKRTMFAMVTGSVLNVIIDPIFIYVFKLGVAGAAYATVLSIMVSCLMLFYFLFIKKDTYVSLSRKDLKLHRGLIIEILRVGIPASFVQLTMSLSIFILNRLIISLGGPQGIAIFTTAWRIVTFGSIPLLGIGTGVTAVTGAAFGAKDKEKLNTGYMYSIKIGLLIELFVLLFISIFARQISFLFTFSKASSEILKPLIIAMRVLVFFLPTTPLGMFTSAMFQGIKQGEKSFVVTFLRTIVFQILFAYLFGYLLRLNLIGVWVGIVFGNLCGSTLGFIWGRITIKKLTF
uniref:MATE family efflux transporter n=1 Tax=candidate division WOR-3 bacterium TaxID=2052148 RepID=A0A7C4Y964_UNCW3